MTLAARTRSETASHDDRVRFVIVSLREVLSPREVDLLEPRLNDIETQACELIRSARANRHDPMVVAAAAVYDSLLQSRNTTSVNIAFQVLGYTTEINESTIASTWSRLFDRSVDLKRHRLEMLSVDDSMTIQDLIRVAVAHLRRGVVSPLGCKMRPLVGFDEEL